MIEKIITYQMLNKIKNKSNDMYSKIVSKEISNISGDAHFEYPVNLHGGEYIKIGRQFVSYRNLRLEAYNFGKRKPCIEIGDNVNIQPNCHIGCINLIKIGRGVVIASNVSILDHFHGEINAANVKISPSIRKCVSKGPIYIGVNVWIGENAVILPNVTIGEGAVIGAGAIVTKDVPAFSVAAGVPAKIIKQFE